MNVFLIPKSTYDKQNGFQCHLHGDSPVALIAGSLHLVHMLTLVNGQLYQFVPVHIGKGTQNLRYCTSSCFLFVSVQN